MIKEGKQLKSVVLKRRKRKIIQSLKKKRRLSINASVEVRAKTTRRIRKFGLKVNRRSKVSNQKNRTLVYAPEIIDYYNKKWFEKTNKFINRIRSIAANGRVLISFHKTQLVTAAAMLSLLSEIDIIVQKGKFGKRSVSFSHPKDPKIESILVQVGLYDIIKKEKRETQEYDDVSYWRYASDDCAQPLLLNDTLQEIKAEIATTASKSLYRGLIEAMANSVEHAYPHSSDGNTSKLAKWWAFAGIKDNKLILVLCDKGVGIPKTLPKTQKRQTLIKALNALGLNFKSKLKDSIYIEAATMIAETKTNQKHRGKGINDMQKVIDSIGEGVLEIFSNRGRYIYKGIRDKVRAVAFDYESSINGTIVEWSIPLDMGDKTNEQN